jgi:hypothetical protein
LASQVGVRERLLCLRGNGPGSVFDQMKGFLSRFLKGPIRARCGEHMFTKLVDAVFGCWHLHYSFPITLRSLSRRSKAASLTGTYVVCLDCGAELPYDWNAMKVVSSMERRANLVAPLASKEAA